MYYSHSFEAHHGCNDLKIVDGRPAFHNVRAKKRRAKADMPVGWRKGWAMGRGVGDRPRLSRVGQRLSKQTENCMWCGVCEKKDQRAE